MSRRFLILLGLCFLVAPFLIRSHPLALARRANSRSPLRPDFTGRWILDKSRSQLDGMFPRNLVQIIEQRGSELKITNRCDHWGGEGLYAGMLGFTVPEMLIFVDGLEHAQPVNSWYQLKSATHWEGSNLITEFQFGEDDRTSMKTKWVRYLSEDGAVQYLDVTNYYPDGEAQPTGDGRLVFVPDKSAEQF